MIHLLQSLLYSPGLLMGLAFSALCLTVGSFVKIGNLTEQRKSAGGWPAFAASSILASIAFLAFAGSAYIHTTASRRSDPIGSVDFLAAADPISNGALAVLPDGGSLGSRSHPSPFDVINTADGGLPFQVDANAAAVAGDFVVSGTFRTGGTNATTLSSIVRGRTSLQVSLNTQTCSDTQKTVTGAALGGQCLASWPGLIAPGALTIGCYVSATDTVQLHVCNPSAGTLATPDGGATGYGMLIFN